MARGLVLSLALAAAFAACARAQGYKLPDNKPEPKTVIKLANGEPWKVWVAYGGYRPRQGWSPSEEPVVGSAPFTFLQACYVGLTNQVDGEYLLLVSKVPNKDVIDVVYGWADKRYLITVATALTDKTSGIHRKAMIVNKQESLTVPPLFDLDGSFRDALEHEQLPEGLRDAFAKAEFPLSGEAKAEVRRPGEAWLIIDEGNKQRFVVERDGDKLRVHDSLILAPVFDAPQEKAKKLANFQLATIFYLYGETDSHVLIGTLPEFEEGPKGVVQGWVARERAAFWNTREALQWDRPSTLGKVLFTENVKAVPRMNQKKLPEELRRLFADHKLSLSDTAAFRVVRPDALWLITDPPDAAQPRYAVYQEGELLVVRDPSTRQRTEPGKIWANPKAAYDWANNDGAALPAPSEQENLLPDGSSQPFGPDDPGQPIIDGWKGTADFPAEHPATLNHLHKVGWAAATGDFTTEQLADIRRELGDYERGLQELDVVFVIDDTYSMKDYQRELGEIIESVVTDPVLRKDRRLRLAISYYNNFPANPPFDAEALSDVNDEKELDRMLTRAKGRGVHGGGSDPEEMVFNGINQAIDKAHWGRLARKMVIVIGDAGDKSKEGADRNVEKQKIVDRLFPEGDTPIEFYSVLLTEDDRPERWQSSAVLFQTQMRAIQALVNARAPKGQTLARFAPASDLKVVRQRMHDRIQELNEESAQRLADLRALKSGDFWYHTKAVGLKEELKAVGVDLDKLHHLEGGEVYKEGYVWEAARDASKAPQLRTTVLLYQTDLFQLVDVLGRIVGTSRGPVRTKGVDDLVNEELAKLTGDPDTKMSLAEALAAQPGARKLGLPFHSDLLTKRPEELKDVKLEMVQDLKLKLARLEDVLNDQRSEWAWGEEKEDGETVLKLRPSNPRAERRHHLIPANPPIKAYWVDLKTEVP